MPFIQESRPTSPFQQCQIMSQSHPMHSFGHFSFVTPSSLERIHLKMTEGSELLCFCITTCAETFVLVTEQPLLSRLQLSRINSLLEGQQNGRIRTRMQLYLRSPYLCSEILVPGHQRTEAQSIFRQRRRWMTQKSRSFDVRL